MCKDNFYISEETFLKFMSKIFKNQSSVGLHEKLVIVKNAIL